MRSSFASALSSFSLIDIERVLSADPPRRPRYSLRAARSSSRQSPASNEFARNPSYSFKAYISGWLGWDFEYHRVADV